MPKKILTIDDDPYIVKYITEVLSDNGYATCSASSVEEALSVLEAERPDLVTLDMEMPDEWGPRFYRKMSMNPAFKDTPVIVISGLQGIHLAIRNAVATLQKPFDPEVLLSIVNRVLESKDAARRASEEGRRACTGGAKALTDGRASLFARKAVRHTATGETVFAGRPTPSGKRHGPHRPTLPILFSDGGILKSRRNTLYL